MKAPNEKKSYLLFQAVLSDLALQCFQASQGCKLLEDQQALAIHHILHHLVSPIEEQLINIHTWLYCIPSLISKLYSSRLYRSSTQDASTYSS